MVLKLQVVFFKLILNQIDMYEIGQESTTEDWELWNIGEK